MKPSDANAGLSASLQRAHRRRMAISGLVILMAGITLGVAGTLVVVRPKQGWPPLDPGMAAELTSRRMQDELGLTPGQVDKIDTILREQFEKLEALRNEARPKINAIFESMKTSIDAVLTEEQRVAWEKDTARLDRMFRRGMHRGPGGPGGPGGPPGGPGRFRRPGPDERPDDGGDRPPRDGRRGRWRPGEGPEPWMNRADSNAVPPPAEPEGQAPSTAKTDPNAI